MKHPIRTRILAYIIIALVLAVLALKRASDRAVELKKIELGISGE